jgi:hypothetical protein
MGCGEGVALFGSLAGSAGGLIAGLKLSLMIAACLLALSSGAALIGMSSRTPERRTSSAG